MDRAYFRRNLGTVRTLDRLVGEPSRYLAEPTDYADDSLILDRLRCGRGEGFDLSRQQRRRGDLSAYQLARWRPGPARRADRRGRHP